MLKDFLTFLGLISLTATVGFAQENIIPCGTIGDLAAPIEARLLQNLNALEDNPVQFRDIQYVPIRFHLVARSDGAGRISEQRVLDQLCALNGDFAEMDIQFYLKGNDYFNYIDNTTVYNDHVSTINTFMSFQRDGGAINIFIVNDATPPNGEDDEGTTLGYHYPFTGKDWLVVRKDEIGDLKSTLPHEIGHFFSLLHPHNGWDAIPWSQNMVNPASTLSPGNVLTERADGSNCSTAGDYICDTPADYNGFGWPDCDYQGGAQDPTGVEIDPDEKLFMGYYLNCPRDEYYYSPTQQSLILADLASPHRSYIRPSYSPPSAVTEAAVPQSPIEGQTTGYVTVNFSWSASPNASSYLVEIARNASFTITPIRFITSNNNLTVSDEFSSERTYYWRVRPFNNLYSCVEFSEPAQFVTGTEATAVNEIKTVSDWVVQPNPVATNSLVNILVHATTSFDANISLFGIQGQAVRQLGNQNFVAGENAFSISTVGLSSGVYFIAIQTDEGQIHKRLVVNN